MTTISTSTSAYFERSTQDMSALRARAESLQQQIGSGARLSRSSDDPVAASRLRTLARADALATVDNTNGNRATADLQLADSALSNFADIVIRAQELATQAANGTLTPGQRAGIATELKAIQGNLLGLANTRDSAGHSLFGGETGGDAYALSTSGSPVYIGTATAGELALGDGQLVKRSLTGPEFLNFTANGAPTDLFQVIGSLADALSVTTGDPAQAARDSLGALAEGLDTLTTGQTQVGARLAWIDLTAERRIATSELHSSEEAEIGGTDTASAISELQQVMLVLQASQASFAKLANLSLFDLLR